ncbi:quinone oxidoreductase family protein [Actinoplanes philippinensis]|uniref:quinone oxidoreductase family protein n=1 Tax=Actinoplanes philippinensis TaxID=35752 RepID=UPI001EF20D8F|nr:zinc-binding alcohol dehydrogenase family protein [Actinoplanes philippinensis]
MVLRECGRPPVLERRAAPVPGDGSVLVDVVAAPITPLDLLCASGTSYFGAPATPYVPGVQGVGHLADGTAVWFATPAGMRPGDGSMASVVAVPEDDLVPLPGGTPLILVAALGLSAVAALGALRAAGSPEGRTVLVLGAGGTVGQAAIQLALLSGARRVIAVARSEAARRHAASLGATAVPIEALDEPVDLVVDPVFGAPAAAALRVLRPGGSLVNLGSAAGATAPIDSATLRSGSLQILGYTNNALSPRRRADMITEIAAHATAGRLTVTHEAIPVTATEDAWERDDPGRRVLTF